MISLSPDRARQILLHATGLLRRSPSPGLAGALTVLNALGKALPEFLGGSADLNPSTFTVLKGAARPRGRHPPRRLGPHHARPRL